MSSIQSGSRRQSARLQHKDDGALQDRVASTNGQHTGTTTTSTRVQTSATKSKKRKNNYDEEDDGFLFSRVKKKKPRPSIAGQPNSQVAPLQPDPAQATSITVDESIQHTEPRPAKKTTTTAKSISTEPVPHDDVPDVQPQKRQKRRMSFSTPSAKESQPVRRSKRLSTEARPEQGSPSAKAPDELRPPKIRKEKKDKQKAPTQSTDGLPAAHLSADISEQVNLSAPPRDETHSATKIALPFADTPVISRNKAMREGKSGKIERRSSLGLRGRRASSLIDSGTSNALPHTEVDPRDFYKHIESELTEPRRMRQLLTWCATRAMHPKPQGTTYAEASARSVARVIEEELLKDLANKPELSEWFTREDDSLPTVPLPERPNPKNASNAEKISELQAQIQRLRSEKEALESLRKPPFIPEATSFGKELTLELEGMLSESDAQTLQSLQSRANLPDTLQTRVNKVITSVGPSIDVFADGIHKINQYRLDADQIASRVLSVCAEKLSEREREGRKKALGLEENRSPARDLSSVLRGLSKAER